MFSKLVFTVLAEWLSWLEHRPAHQRAAVSILSQGTYLGCGFDPWSSAYGRHPIDISPSHQCFFPSLPLSEINKTYPSLMIILKRN